MKEQLLQTIETVPVEARLNLAREYLQAYMLYLMHQAGGLAGLVFVGGTALRLLHRLPRFSENLDFSAGESPPEPDALFGRMERELDKAGYSVRLLEVLNQ